jgi:hypothetical protein
MKNIFLFFLIPVVATAQIPQAAKEDLLREFGSRDVIAIGDLTPSRLSAEFVTEVLDTLKDELDWVALQIPSSRQGSVSEFVYGRSFRPPPSGFNDIILDKIRDINRQRWRPIEVIAMDKEFAGSAHSYFATAGAEMYRTLFHADVLSGRGLVYSRMIHLLNAPAPLPKSFGINRSGITLGMLLEQAAHLKLLKVALGTDMLWSDKWSAIPPDYRVIHKVLTQLRPNALTNMEAADRPANLPFPLAGNFDLAYRVEHEFGLAAQCRALLENPQKIRDGWDLWWRTYRPWR